MNYYNLSSIRSKQFRLCIIIVMISGFFPALSQDHTSLTGRLKDRISLEAIPYAQIALFSVKDSAFISGQISDTTGFFKFQHIPTGSYHLIISMAGYKQFSDRVDVTAGLYDTGVILLNTNVIGFKETVITADRLKGQSDKDKTLYFITKRMIDASSNGLDVVKQIPGIQVDFRRNLTLEGSQNILILVDGIERDHNYVSQIRPDCIDKVEIISAPTSMYDGNINGVINIVLKKEKNMGIGGQINMEIPSGSKYYIHPDYNFSFVSKKLNIYTSYNGELISLDQHESLSQKINVDNSHIERNSDQLLKQKFWSHRFHYGIDLLLSSRSRVNFYVFFNPYSQKYTGSMETGPEGSSELWQAKRLSEDKSRGTNYSLNFKHQFNDKGNDLSIDINNYHYTGEYNSTYSALNANPEFPAIINSSSPELNAFSLKIDLNAALNQKLKMSLGTRMRIQSMRELNNDDFQYTEKIYALYGTLGYNLSRLDISSGIRIEKSISELKYSFRNPEVSLLPFAMVNLKISSDKNLRMGVNRTIIRPNLYQLNPVLSIDDPNNMRQGNPFLKPELRTAIYMEYSKKFSSNYFSAKLFYNRNARVIGNLSFLNDTLLLERHLGNLGTIHQSGFQVSGTFKIGKILSFVPYLRLYSNYCVGNNSVKHYSIVDRHQFVTEPGFSSILSFKHDISMSVVFQYSSPRNSMQGNSFSDAFYMISLEKIFLKCLKAGIVSALPFKDQFTYQGSEIQGGGFYSKYSGDVLVSGSLFWFKLGYQFNMGKKVNKTNRTIDESEILPKKEY